MIDSLEEGAHSLLGECVSILEENRIKYVIIGGWSPFLLNPGAIRHPGTKDVDILFEDGSTTSSLKEVLNLFVNKGFYYSAKHNFQLLRKYNIQEQPFIYNVDLIHPVESKQSLEFVDHLNVPVKVSKIVPHSYVLRTISLPGSQVFFDGLSNRRVETFILENGEEKEIEFTLLNEAGLIISKCKSFNESKRIRDSFDIFIAIHQSKDYDNLVKTLKNLKVTYPVIFGMLETLRNAVFNETPNNFYKNILATLVEVDDHSFTKENLEYIVQKFFVDINFDA